VILTRWHEDDLAGRLIAEDGSEWRVLNIPAQADHNPAKGQTDVLGRQPGEFMVSARGRTLVQWERRKRTSGSRAWTALYQGRPSPAEGGILKAGWWKRYDTPQWIQRADGSRVVHVVAEDAELIQSWDMAFKDTKSSDYVVGQVWLRRGVNAYLLDQVRGRWSFAETCDKLLALTARWPQATAKLIEDKANGPAVMNSLRLRVGGMIPVEPEGSKEARAHAVSPLIQAGNVFLPDPLDDEGEPLAPWVDDFVEEAKAFPNATHDDQVDAMTQAVHRLLLVSILAEGLITSDDLIDDEPDEIDLEFEGAGISRY
jgi:predicted phage terminase large subunit-like protein